MGTGGYSVFDRFLQSRLFDYAILAVLSGFILLGSAFIGQGAWEQSARFRAASQGTGGMPGTVVGAEWTPPGAVTPGRCQGTFRPDGGGPGPPHVQVDVEQSKCVHAKTFDGRLVHVDFLSGDKFIHPGDESWKTSRNVAILAWVSGPAGVVALVIRDARAARKRRNNPGRCSK